MSSLETHLNALIFSSQLDAIKNLINRAQAKTTFWGSRVIEIDGFTSSVYLDDIAKKILRLGTLSYPEDLLPAARANGFEIVQKLESFYRVTDTQIQNANFCTRFLSWIRTFSLFSYTTNFHIRKTSQGYFEAYFCLSPFTIRYSIEEIACRRSG